MNDVVLAEDAEVALNEGQDHLYFLHRDLYWSRLKSADIAVAAGAQP